MRQTKLYLILSMIVTLFSFIKCQNSLSPTALDIYPLNELYTASRLILGRSSGDPVNLRRAKQDNILQKEVPLSEPFPCDVTDFRSSKPPSSVHQLRPGDIDVVGALGDSVTAGFGLVATNIIQVLIQNRGLSWSIGGQDTWRQYVTLPNILKEFNPNLFGYSLGDSISAEHRSQFNPAELAMSSEMPYMAKLLIQRIKSDKRVDLKNHWKLITLMIGFDEICVDVCFHQNLTEYLEVRRQALITTLRLLRDNLPRTIVNFVAPPNMKALINQKGTPGLCSLILRFQCFCLSDERFTPNIKKYLNLNIQMQKADEEVANMSEFHQNKDFTVVFQPFLIGASIPLLKNNLTDWSYMSKDCYHLSQKMDARAGNAIWNNMIEKVGNKSATMHPLFDQFLCPTKENPYIFTNENSL